MSDFTWGDPVRVVPTAPTQFRPGELASLCGFWPEPGAGCVRVVLEFADGSSVEVPLDLVEDAGSAGNA